MFNSSKESEETKMRALALKNGMFDSKRSTFDYYYFYEGKSAEESERLSTLVISARGIPEVPEAPKSTMDKIKVWVDQGTKIYKEYPQVSEFVIGLISGAATSLLGVAVGNKVSEKKDDEPVAELNNVEPLEINDNAEPIQHQN